MGFSGRRGTRSYGKLTKQIADTKAERYRLLSKYGEIKELELYDKELVKLDTRLMFLHKEDPGAWKPIP